MYAARDHHDPAGEQPSVAARSPSAIARSDAAVVVCCRRCGSDLSALAAGAVYCPRCGLRRPGEAGAADGVGRDGTFSSTIIRSYANAMFRLGTHYEVRHNEAEAVRCYGKASHLGNVPAKVCLLDIALSKRLQPPRDALPPS